MASLSNFVPRLAGKLFVAAVVQRFTSQGSLFGGAPMQSATAGSSWTWAQYLVAILSVQLGSRLFGRILGGSAAAFREGGMDLIWTKLIWTEGMARSSMLTTIFGAVPDGQVSYDPITGQTWVNQGGRYDAMQGLVQASPLDGLVQASPLDGMGHLMPSSTPIDEARTGAYTGSGYTNAYHAAYAR